MKDELQQSAREQKAEVSERDRAVVGEFSKSEKEKDMNRRAIFAFVSRPLFVLKNVGKAAAQTTNVTHQGNLRSAIGGPNFEFEFKLFDSPTVDSESSKV